MILIAAKDAAERSFNYMRMEFLGTGAADTQIALYENSKSFRRNSSALINDNLLIDPGPHIFHYAETLGHEGMLDNVKNIIVTHSHYDHFNPENFKRLHDKTHCTLWSDRACIRRLCEYFGEEYASSIDFVETVPFTEYSIGGYTVTFMPSNHATPDRDETERVLLISDGTRMLFYGCDCSWIPTKTWNYMKSAKINTMVLELTCGTQAYDDWRLFEHNTIDSLLLMLRMFRKYSLFADDVKYYTSHMAVTLHGSHEELCSLLEPHGVIPAYDGMKIDI